MGGARRIDTVVIGAGHAGLCMSYALQQAGREHVVLEQRRALEQWRSARWDSFRMNAPIAYSRLMGQADGRPDAQRSIPLGEMLRLWDECIAARNFPIRAQCRVVSVEATREGRFAVAVVGGAGAGLYDALNVVAAPGRCQTPYVPGVAARLPARIRQLRVGTYTTPAAIGGGAILVVGGGQTGVQLSEELALAGRRVYLATSRVAGTPRDHRGEDIMVWLDRTNMLATPAAQVDAGERRRPMPIVGHDHAISHHSLARLGVTLLGRLRDISADGAVATFGDDLADHVRFARQGHDELVAAIENWIAQADPEWRAACAPPTEEPAWRPHPPLAEKSATRLDLAACDIGTVVWATGWSADLAWLHIPGVRAALDPQGLPQACDTPVDGFFWLGFDWLRTRSSGTIAGFHRDAPYIARRLRA